MKKPSKRPSKVTKPFADGTMTSSAFFTMLRAALRQKSRFYISIRNCKERAKIKYTGTNKRRKWSYVCEICKKEFESKEVVVHHKDEAGKLNNFEDLPGFVERLFCDSNKLLCICKECHTSIHQIKK